MSERTYKLLDGSELIVRKEALGVRNGPGRLIMAISAEGVMDDVLALVDEAALETARLRKELEEAQQEIKHITTLLDDDVTSALTELHEYYSRRYAAERDAALEDCAETKNALEEAQQTIARLETKLQASRDSVYNISVEGDEARAERNELKAQLAEAQQTNLQLQAALQQVKSYTHPGWQSDYKTAKDALYTSSVW